MHDELRQVRIQGRNLLVPDDTLTDPYPFRSEFCDAREPEWPDGSGGMVVCTLLPHPPECAHVANNGGTKIIAIWWDEP